MHLPDENKTRLLARIIRSVLHDEPFETIADLVDAVKFRCARLHIRPSVDDLNAALRAVASNRSLVTPRSVPRGTSDPTVSDAAVSHDEAARILARLGVEL